MTEISNFGKSPKRSVFARSSTWIVFVVMFFVAALAVVRVEPNLKWVATDWVLGKEKADGKEAVLLKTLLGVKYKFSEEDFLSYVGKGDLESVLHFLSAGINMDAKSSEGMSAVDIAVARNDLDMIKLLAGKGANVNVAAADGLRPLSRAVKVQNPQMVQTLVGLGANVNGASTDGRTPLMQAVTQEYTPLARILLDLGTNINLADRSGRTALHYAIRTGNPALVRMVLDAGANVNKVDSTGVSPLDLAVAERNVQLLKMIRDAGGQQGGGRSPKMEADIEDEAAEPISDEEWMQEALGLKKDEPEPAPDPAVEPLGDPAFEPLPVPTAQAAPTPVSTPPPAPTPARSGKTRVRALGLPKGVFLRKGGLTLDSVTVRAKNLSHVTATGVNVQVRLPNGSLASLQGPTTLSGHQTAVYSAKIEKKVVSMQKMKAVITCTNCYR